MKREARLARIIKNSQLYHDYYIALRPFKVLRREHVKLLVKALANFGGEE